MSTRPLTHAIVRRVSASLSECLLTYLPRHPIDPSLASQQHEAYVEALAQAGLQVTVLPAEPLLPDAVFVEDLAVILDEFVIAGCAAASARRDETRTLLPVLRQIREVRFIQLPGTLEGGDMLMAGKTIFAGLSSRTNEAGVDQLEKVVLAEGYRVERVTVRGCLHLKTAVTSVSPGVFLANPAWIDLAPFQRHEIINVPDTEPWGANTVAINESMLVAESAPRTGDLLRDRNLNVVPVNISELQKAEAGLSCLSLLYRR